MSVACWTCISLTKYIIIDREIYFQLFHEWKKRIIESRALRILDGFTLQGFVQPLFVCAYAELIAVKQQLADPNSEIKMPASHENQFEDL